MSLYEVIFDMKSRTIAGVYKDLLKRLRKDYDFGAMISVKAGRPMVGLLLRTLSPIGRSLTNMSVIAVVRFCSDCSRITRNGGLRFLVIYLKACSTMLQQSLGNSQVVDQVPFGARVSRTGCGLPRMIHARHRALIKAGNPSKIRLWMTLFGLYRILEIPGKVNLSTITDPCKGALSLIEDFTAFVPIFCKLVRRHFEQEGSLTDALWPEEERGPLQFLSTQLRAVPFVISKVGPTAQSGTFPGSPTSTSPATIVASAYVWKRHALYPTLKSWCQMTGNTWVINRMDSLTRDDLWLDVMDGGLSTPLDRGSQAKIPNSPFEALESIGNLGFKTEPAGKVRVFAMVDCWTQWLLGPLHKAIFALLRRIPQDGTFDQLGPIQRLLALKPKQLFSFDLSAATDRIPLLVQKILLSGFIGHSASETWAELLVGRPYKYGKLSKKDFGIDLPSGEVRYAVGQPMGALSSWAMLALVHHALIQFAAFRVSKEIRWFPLYAVLGDDVTIADRAVAQSYQFIMDDLGVGIGIHKSLISWAGRALEFAKRTFFKGIDVSMLPIAEFMAAVNNIPAFIEYVRKYALTLGQAFSALGYGYRVKSRIGAELLKLSPRMRLYLLALKAPGAPYFTGIRSWIGMKSWTSVWKQADIALPHALKHILEREREYLLERLTALDPLLVAVKKLATVYRDREFYGTVKRGAKAPSMSTWGSGTAPVLQVILKLQSLVTGPPAITLPGDIRITSHVGLVAEYSQSALDLVNELVYRNAYLDVLIDIRDLRESIESLDVLSGDWEELGRLWVRFDDVESRLGTLPLPRNIYTRPRSETKVVKSKNIRRWAAYQGTFRRTKFAEADLPTA